MIMSMESIIRQNLIDLHYVDFENEKINNYTVNFTGMHLGKNVVDLSISDLRKFWRNEVQYKLNLLVLIMPITLCDNLDELFKYIGNTKWKGQVVMYDLVSVFARDWIRESSFVKNLSLENVYTLTDKIFKIVWTKWLEIRKGKNTYITH